MEGILRLGWRNWWDIFGQKIQRVIEIDIITVKLNMQPLKNVSNAKARRVVFIRNVQQTSQNNIQENKLFH